MSRVGDVVSAQGSALGIAFKEGRVVVVNETSDSGFPGIESFIVAPLRSGGRTFGALNIGAYQPRSYGQQEIGLIVITSYSIHYTKLYEVSAPISMAAAPHHNW